MPATLRRTGPRARAADRGGRRARSRSRTRPAGAAPPSATLAASSTKTQTPTPTPTPTAAATTATAAKTGAERSRSPAGKRPCAETCREARKAAGEGAREQKEGKVQWRPSRGWTELELALCVLATCMLVVAYGVQMMEFPLSRPVRNGPASATRSTPKFKPATADIRLADLSLVSVNLTCYQAAPVASRLVYELAHWREWYDLSQWRKWMDLQALGAASAASEDARWRQGLALYGESFSTKSAELTFGKIAAKSRLAPGASEQDKAFRRRRQEAKQNQCWYVPPHCDATAILSLETGVACTRPIRAQAGVQRGPAAGAALASAGGGDEAGTLEFGNPVSLEVYALPGHTQLLSGVQSAHKGPFSVPCAEEVALRAVTGQLPACVQNLTVLWAT